MNKNFDVIIIGGGFSGLVLANSLKTKKLKVAIFERLDRVGKKILSTGNGRGNLTNKVISVSNYHGKNPEFASYALERFNNFSLKSFFSNLGLMFVEEDCKIYPSSMQANSVLDALRFGLQKSEAVVNVSEKVEKIAREGNGFKLTSSSGIYYAKNVVFAFGGKSQKQFGTDGFGFELAKQLGLKVSELYPSLVQLKTNLDNIRGFKGIKSQVKVELLNGDKLVNSTFGDLLFTDSGVSGNTIFYLSSYIHHLPSPKLKIEFIPEITINRLIDHLLYKKQEFSHLESQELLNGIVHKQISKSVIKRFTSAQFIKDITKAEIEKICREIKAFELNVLGTLSFDYSQVTHGGILTSQFNEKTFECLSVPNLYAIGECLDIDGDCGGYNLQWAFSSAMCCGGALNDKIN